MANEVIVHTGLVVINQLTLQDYARNPTVIVNPKLVGPYSNKHHILVVGDGNLSFSLDLASELVRTAT